MDNLHTETRQIAARLRGARLTAEKSAAELAACTGMSEEAYLKMEEGLEDYSFTFLYKCAKALGIDFSALVSGDDPKLSFYTLTRAGEGMPIKRRAGFHYRHLASKLKHRAAEPFVVTARYDEAGQTAPIPLSTHDGQEFDMVLSGSLRVQLDDHIELLGPGDSVFYDSSHPHGMVAAGGTDCTFLAVVFKPVAELPDAEGELPAEPAPVVRPADAKTAGAKYDGLIYHNFAREKIDENGCLTGIELLPPENFNFGYDVVDALARKCPDKRAMLWLSRDKEERDFTFAEISALSNRTANYFASLGIGKGDRVMLVLKRHYQFWLSILALHKLGAVAIPATSLLVRHDYEYRFEAAQVKAIVCTGDGECAAEVDLAQESSPTLQIKIIANGSRPGWHSFDEEMPSFPDTLERVPTSRDDPAIMFFTSGTTGYPKIATHTASYPLGHIVTARWWHNVEPDGLHLTISDTGWGKALWGKLYGQWLCESAIFVYDFDRFKADDLLPLFKKYNITTFCAPPTMYRFFIKEDLSRYDLSSLHYVTIAGEALNPEVFHRFYEATGLKLMEGFGQTETTLAIANLYGMTPKVGSMGRPNPQYDVDIVDENGKSVPVGETGEIVIRADRNAAVCGLFAGYYRDEEKTAEAWHDGLYHTGDTAWRDEDGYYWYVGRIDDVIKSSGYRIGPFEIESVIMELPYVLECAVTGVPDETRGQVVKATIVLTKGTSPSEELKKEIQDYVKKHTAPYKYPRRVDFVAELPKTISGKIRRVELKD